MPASTVVAQRRPPALQAFGAWGFRVTVRAATRAKPALVSAVHAFYHGEDAGTEHPDRNITQHSSTGARYPSLHAFYAPMGVCNTRGKGVKNGSVPGDEL